MKQMEEILSEKLKLQKQESAIEDFSKSISRQQILCSEQFELLNRKEVSELLKISLSSVHNWAKQGILKKYGLGGRVYFKMNEIEKSLIHLK